MTAKENAYSVIMSLTPERVLVCYIYGYVDNSGCGCGDQRVSDIYYDDDDDDGDDDDAS